MYCRVPVVELGQYIEQFLKEAIHPDVEVQAS
jgi:hypothetical protein